eukprot:1046422-Amphidinium_carterae.3
MELNTRRGRPCQLLRFPLTGVMASKWRIPIRAHRREHHDTERHPAEACREGPERAGFAPCEWRLHSQSESVSYTHLTLPTILLV